MNKEQLEKFIAETLNAPNFSVGYDRDNWERDKQELIEDLETLEVLKTMKELLKKWIAKGE